MKELFLLVCLYVCLHDVFCCSCWPELTIQMYKCTAREITAPDGVSLLDQNRLYTVPTSGFCGITGFRRGKRYIMTGRYYNKLVIGCCSSLVQPYRLKGTPYKSLIRNPPSCPLTTTVTETTETTDRPTTLEK